MQMVNFFKSLADETRLRLLQLLSIHELNVNEIVEILEMSQPRISRHLKILTDHQLLSFRRDGLWIFYTAKSHGDGSRFIKAVKPLFEKETMFSNDLEKAGKIIEKRAKESTRFFDSIAEDWEKLKTDIIGEFELNDFILKHLSPGQPIVDLGCGTGDLMLSLKKKHTHVIGVDKSLKMLEEARKRFSGAKRKFDLRIGEIEHLPLGNAEAEVAIINMVLHHLVSPLAAFKEINRILKNNGHFAIIYFLKHHQENMRMKYGDRWLGFHEKEIKKWLAQTGFEIEETDFFKLKKDLKGFMITSKKKGENDAKT
jgi:ubiquinone/menaquinone biosynthesis C-methylase UbiE